MVRRYAEWANDYQENQITIIYDTMWNGTRRMAEAIAEGVRSEDSEVAIKLFNCARSDKNDIITEVFRSRALLVGSPTVNQHLLSSVAGILEEMGGLRFKKKKAAAFGTYGWSGESVRLIQERLREGGFEIVNDGVRALWNPDEEAIADCTHYGKELALSLR
jgi:flavorubredoxin